MDGAVKRERVHVGLKEGRPLLQTVDRQMVSGAQGVLVAALVDPTMGPPGAPDSYPHFTNRFCVRAWQGDSYCRATWQGPC
jgi:hypothetical protein